MQEELVLNHVELSGVLYGVLYLKIYRLVFVSILLVSVLLIHICERLYRADETIKHIVLPCRIITDMHIFGNGVGLPHLFVCYEQLLIGIAKVCCLQMFLLCIVGKGMETLYLWEIFPFLSFNKPFHVAAHIGIEVIATVSHLLCLCIIFSCPAKVIGQDELAREVCQNPSPYRDISGSMRMPSCSSSLPSRSQGSKCRFRL